VSTSLDPRTLATPNEQVVLGRGLAPNGVIRVVVDGSTSDEPALGSSDASPASLRFPAQWEVAEAGAVAADDVHVLLLLGAGGSDGSDGSDDTDGSDGSDDSDDSAVAEGSPSERLASVRPWVVLLRTDRDDRADWERELGDAGYLLTMFDGRTRYFVHPEHVDLPAALAVGDATAWDDLVDEVVRWRTAALGRWAVATGSQPGRQSVVERELQAMRQTVSWRVTAPLRKVRTRMRP
jgi:hypothetical protein